MKSNLSSYKILLLNELYPRTKVEWNKCRPDDEECMTYKRKSRERQTSVYYQTFAKSVARILRHDNSKIKLDRLLRREWRGLFLDEFKKLWISFYCELQEYKVDFATKTLNYPHSKRFTLEWPRQPNKVRQAVRRHEMCKLW